jgi:hypothetical protein
MRTTLTFPDHGRFELSQFATSATLGHSRPSRWSFRGSIGAILDGGMTSASTDADISAGFVVGFGVSKQWPLSHRMFINGSVDLGASRVTTHQGHAPGVALIATDIRVGAIFGRTFGRVSPFVLARLFGGPVFWQSTAGEAITGTDIYHVQLGAGASVSVGSGLSLMVDVSALGEQAASLALSKQF